MVDEIMISVITLWKLIGASTVCVIYVTSLMIVPSFIRDTMNGTMSGNIMTV